MEIILSVFGLGVQPLARLVKEVMGFLEVLELQIDGSQSGIDGHKVAPHPERVGHKMRPTVSGRRIGYAAEQQIGISQVDAGADQLTAVRRTLQELTGTLIAPTGRVGPAGKIVRHAAMVPGHSGQILVSGMPVAPMDDRLPFAPAIVRVALHLADHSPEQIDTQPRRGVGQCTLQDGQGGIRAGRFGIKFVQMRTDETVYVGSGAGLFPMSARRRGDKQTGHDGPMQ